MLSARFNAELNWRDIFKEVKTTGVDTVDGKECYKVRADARGRFTHHTVLRQAIQPDGEDDHDCGGPHGNNLGDQTVDSFATDYRKEGDVLMPHKIRQLRGRARRS